MIVIGASRGGLKAVQTILRQLPAVFPIPVAIVLHRYREVDDLIVTALQKHSVLPVTEVVDKEPIQPGNVFLAPANYHLLTEPTCFSLSTDEPVQFARPSIDVLFESAADAFGAMIIGVILTGSSEDGACGAAQIQQRGGTVIVQNPEEAESSIMPAAALAAAEASLVRSLDQIAGTLIQLTHAMKPERP